MKEFEIIKNYYKPIQPAVKANNGEIVYQENYPDKEIENFIYCFWQLKTKKSLKEPFIYRVVSDGCIDIFFNHNQPTENFVMGFCKKYTKFPIGKAFNYIGIRFLPSAFPLLFRVDAKSLSNQSQRLQNVLPDLSKWIISEIKSSEPFEKITKQLNKKLIEIVRKQDFQYDKRFFNTLHLIFQKKGFLDIEKELQTGLSTRQLRRIFNYYIGTTSKRFSNVVRFQHILNAKPSKQSLKENKLYYDVGFYDQAHFIKHFKTFYGITPSEAFY
ncbi:AraC family transcriptional regulator [Aquimarina algicola]|uniref:AraC family transcriptional regulator n=1 Tax=Aquimarina algicola TaxID=2589995 RepID=A0A504JBT4_9FLAO|nr:helix-turn-helix domain-containing protein [Aquimarina algicola]TPN84050.1 AraC family transcriptional regulator [Aquimarina algicola]